MKKTLTALASGLVLMGMTGMVHASLVTIGTGMFTYPSGAPVDGVAHNLIWDNDNNGKSVVWLDHSFLPTTRAQMMVNIAGAHMDITLNGYTVDWVDDTWRMPSINGTEAWGYDANTTEIGHLFYDELGLSSGPTTVEQLNATNFDHLIPTAYFFSEKVWDSYAYFSWFFAMGNGGQNVCDIDGAQYGLAIREANVSAVPVPGAVWLLGSGLIGLLGIRRPRNGNRV